MRALTAAAVVAFLAALPHTAVAKDDDDRSTKNWQAQVRDQPIRAAASVQGEFRTDQITVSLKFSSVHETFDGLITTLQRRKTDITREAQAAGMGVAEVTITAMELRQRRSDSDNFGYFGDVTVLLTVIGFTDPLAVAARLNKLPARSVGELQYSLSKDGLEKAKGVLRNQALAKIRREAVSEAELRNTQLGDMHRFEFEALVNRRSAEAVDTVVISGRGLAVFKPSTPQ